MIKSCLKICITSSTLPTIGSTIFSSLTPLAVWGSSTLSPSPTSISYWSTSTLVSSIRGLYVVRFCSDATGHVVRISPPLQPPNGVGIQYFKAFIWGRLLMSNLTTGFSNWSRASRSIVVVGAFLLNGSKSSDHSASSSDISSTSSLKY